MGASEGPIGTIERSYAVGAIEAGGPRGRVGGVLWDHREELYRVSVRGRRANGALEWS